MDDISLNITADNNNGLVDAFDYDGTIITTKEMRKVLWKA